MLTAVVFRFSILYSLFFDVLETGYRFDICRVFGLLNTGLSVCAGSGKEAFFIYGLAGLCGPFYFLFVPLKHTGPHMKRDGVAAFS